MAKKSNFIKNLLTTASAVAVLAGGVSTAVAAQNRNTAANADLSTQTGIAGWVTGDWITVNGAHALNFDVVGAVVPELITTQVGGAITVTEKVYLGSVNGGNNAGAVTVNANKELVLIGGDNAGRNNNSYAKFVGALDVTGAGSKLTIDTAVPLAAGPHLGAGAGAINLNATDLNAAAANGTLNVYTELTTNKYKWGTFGTINIGRDNNAGSASKLTLSTVGADNVLQTAAGNKINFVHDDSELVLLGTNANQFTINTGTIGGAVGRDNSGIVTLTGAAGVLTVVGAAPANGFGASDVLRLKKLEISGDQDVAVNVDTYAKFININATGNAPDIIFGGIVNTAADGSMKITDVNTASVTLSQNSTIGTFDFNNNDKILKVADQKVLTGNIVGDVGTPANTAGKVELLGRAEWNGIGTRLNLLTAGDTNLQTAKISGAGDHSIVELQIANTGTVEIADGVNLTNTLINETVGGAAGNLTFLGSGLVGGRIGNNAAVGNILIAGADGKIVTFGGATVAAAKMEFTGTGAALLKGTGYTGDMLFTADGKLKISEDSAHTITGDITIAADAAGKGTIEIASNVGTNANRRLVKFDGKVGDQVDNGGVKLLKVDSQFADLEFDGDVSVHIKSLVLNGDANVKLSKAAGTYRFGGITTAVDGNNTLAIAEDVTLVGNNAGAPAVNLGAENAKLKALDFATDNTLTVGDGVNIYANKLSTSVNNAGNNGALVFAGSSILDAAIDTAGATSLKSIDLGANDKIVEIKQNIKTQGAINFTGTGTFKFGGTSLTATGGITKAAAGKLIFNNTGAAEVDAAVAAGLDSVEFNGGDVKFVGAGAFGANGIKLTSVNSATIEFNAATDIGNNVITSTSANTQTIVINQDTTFTKAVGAADKFVNIQIKQDKVATADSAANPTTSLAGVTFTTDVDNTGTLIIDEETTKIRGVGADGTKLKVLTFNTSGEVTGDVFATASTVAAGKTATFGGRVKGTNLTLAGVNSAAVFKNGASLEANLVDTLGNKGKATFEGNATLNNVIGGAGKRLAEVKFTGDGSNIALSNNIHATAIGFAKQNIAVNDNVILDGLATLNGSNVALNNNKVLTASGAAGGLVLTGDVKVTTSISENNGDNLVGGSIKLTSGTTLSYNGLTNLLIDIQGSTTPSPKERSFAIIDNTDGTAVADANKLTLDKLKVDFDKTSLSTWEKAIDANGGVVITQKNNVVGGITESFKRAGVAMSGADTQNLALIASGTGDAELLVDALNGMKNNAKRAETIQRLIANEINQELENVVSDAATSVAGRMFVNNPGNLGGQPIESAYNDAAPISGVAAGEEAGRYGVWANPFFGNGTQKARKGTAGFKSERYGASVGFDVKANDNMMVGAAMTYLNTNIKHKDQKVGDTTKADSVLFSIYGMQQFTDNWFGQGIATFGSNKVKNNEGRVLSDTMTKRAVGNYTSMSFGGEVMAGYNYFMDQFTLTPMAGLRYTRVNDGGYRESGADFENLDVNKKASNKFEVVVGARAAARSFELNGMYVTPEVHGFINHDIVGKNPDVQMRLNGVNGSLASNKSKPAKTNYTLGAGLNASYGMMDYGVGYDANIANKYLGHQGTVKVRVNF